MIYLTFTVDDISTVIQVYDQILIERSTSETGTYATVSGVGPITLVAGTSSYSEIDDTGSSTNWYRSRYYSTTSDIYSGYSSPTLGDAGDLFHNPTYPPEVSYGTSEQLVIDRIRHFIGDEVGLVREQGEEANSNVLEDDMTYLLSEKGWPASVTVNNVSFTETSNPVVNGYRYLKFSSYIDDITIVCSGTEQREYGVDIWYYTFRWSDREIMEAYDNCPPPPGLTTTTATSEAYMMYTAITLLQSENWADGIEDGALIRDEGTTYDPTPGFEFREALLDDLNKKLDDLIKTLVLAGIQGVRVE